MNYPVIFKESGYPIIKVYENYFEIKAIDYWEFRKFDFSEVKNIEIKNPTHNLLYQFYLFTSLFAQLFSGNEPNSLKIHLKNNGDWSYICTNKKNQNFENILKLIQQKILEN